jgi:hypothetical protein
MTNEMRALVKGVKAHALANYETDGWDVVVECRTDEDIAEEIAGCKTVMEAVKVVGDTAKMYDDHRKEIQATAF